jgi:histidinol-phosphate phosphatase family protein
MLRPAVFLDRDGTLIHDRRYISRPEDVELIAGAAGALRALRDAGFAIVVVTNQSGIGRGYFELADYERVQRRMTELLGAEGATVDAAYLCPHAPGDACECRKPGTLLFRRAAAELGLDPARSWAIGDRWRDLEPAIELGGRGVLVPHRDTEERDVERARERALLAPTIADAAALVVHSAGVTAPDGAR